tara:strand:+ start:2760 stop:3170 length:411 start_codon:yes stop_codon:yes gene_type:complete
MLKHTTIKDPITSQPWTIRVVLKGDNYGRDNCLTHNEEPMVEFYDARHIRDCWPVGQFVSRYYVKSLKDDKYGPAHPGPNGLDLDSSQPSWSVTFKGMHLVMDFVDSVLAEKRKEDLHTTKNFASVLACMYIGGGS